MPHDAASLSRHPHANPQRSGGRTVGGSPPRLCWVRTTRRIDGSPYVTKRDGSRWLAHQGEAERARRLGAAR